MIRITYRDFHGRETVETDINVRRAVAYFRFSFCGAHITQATGSFSHSFNRGTARIEYAREGN